CVTL
ncbi:hypothetical protein CP03DC29_0443B, partial [Chlamydia psittaci 03DC29]